MEEKVIKAALLGLGTVGTGVYKVLKGQEEEMTTKIGCKVKIRKILVRNLEKAAAKVDDPAMLTNSWEEIKQDPSIDIVIELIGGIEPARTYILDALHAGKHVVTANKDLIAVHGKELLDAAKASHVDLLFEAAVAGGIPIIRPLKQCLAGNHMSEVMGIVNGTTNFILTKMSQDNMEFKDALALAAKLGYAEADPTADVEGYDACRKIAILTSLVCGKTVDFEEIHTEGISKITPEDIAYAKAMGRSIKLLATSRGDGNGYYAMVAPFMLGEDHPLNNVNGVFNAIFVHGNMLGDAMFYGSGAGKLPTASAVAADIVDIAKHLKRNIMITYSAEKMNLLDYKQAEYAYFVRTTDSEEQVKAVFDNPALIKIKEVTGETAFVTAKMKEETYLEKAKQLSGIKQMIRVD